MMVEKDWKGRGIFGLGFHQRGKRRKFLLGGAVEAVKAIIPIEQSIIDIGASHGNFTRKLFEAGYDIHGIDGTPGVEEVSDGLVKEHDILDRGMVGVADWGVFQNVGEHVHQRYELELVEAVSEIPKKGLIVAWADKETPDRRAPNRHYDFYVASIFGLYGWLVDEQATLKAREIVGEYSRMNKRLLVMRKGIVE